MYVLHVHVCSSIVVDFFNRLNLIYGAVSEFCTDISCPVMSGGPKYVYAMGYLLCYYSSFSYTLCITLVHNIIMHTRFEYYWADEVQKKPQKLPAPQVGLVCPVVKI